jgi:protein-arginine kinase activator protein McsA
MASAYCEGCGEYSFLIPLHGGKGGPLRCPLCVGAWNAEHGRRRRTGRIVIRAIKAFVQAGGGWHDIDKLKNSALFSEADLAIDLRDMSDPLGYMADIARLDGADVDLTSELLDDTLQLTHPDHHPPERKELAHRVTQGLLSLKPFVFPAPKPEPKPDYPTDATARRSKKPSAKPEPKPSERPAYPCSDCADTTPSNYSDACSAEYDRREQQKTDRRTAKQRADYKRRRERTLKRRPLRHCEECGIEFKRTRTDARYCSDTCRQRAHRKAPVTPKNSTTGISTTKRDNFWQRGILRILARRDVIYLNDLLPENRTRAQYQALCRVVAALEDAGKIDSRFPWWQRGRKLLMRRGYKYDQDDPRPLPPRERLRLTP